MYDESSKEPAPLIGAKIDLSDESVDLDIKELEVQTEENLNENLMEDDPLSLAKAQVELKRIKESTSIKIKELEDEISNVKKLVKLLSLILF